MIEGNVDLLENEEEFLNKVRPIYAVYQCSDSTETRGSHMKGKPCGAWEMRMFRKHSINSLKNSKKGTIQMLCPCGNRPRKEVGELDLFIDKRTAQLYKSKKNAAYYMEYVNPTMPIKQEVN